MLRKLSKCSRNGLPDLDCSNGRLDSVFIEGKSPKSGMSSTTTVRLRNYNVLTLYEGVVPNDVSVDSFCVDNFSEPGDHTPIPPCKLSVIEEERVCGSGSSSRSNSSCCPSCFGDYCRPCTLSFLPPVSFNSCYLIKHIAHCFHAPHHREARGLILRAAPHCNYSLLPIWMRGTLQCCSSLLVPLVPPFGVPLELQFNPDTHQAPPILLAVVHALDYITHTSSAPMVDACVETVDSQQIQLVRHAILRACPGGQYQPAVDPGDVPSLKDMPVSALAGFLRRYLSELPVTIIPSTMYSSFIDIASQPDKTSRLDMLHSLLQALPPHGLAVLKCVLALLCRVSQHDVTLGKTARPVHLADVFSLVMMRPLWEHITKLGTWMRAQVEIFSLLFFECDWGERCPDYHEVTVPLPTSIGLLQEDFTRDVEVQPYFWGEKREEALRRIDGSLEGSFLVRYSSQQPSECQYTLMVRHRDQSICLRVYQNSGKFGLVSQDLRWGSLVDLVDYFRDYDLSEYNSNFSCRLLHPVTCFDPSQQEEGVSLDGLKCNLEEVSVALKMKTEEYDNVREERQRRAQTLQDMRQSIVSFDLIKVMFVEQLNLHRRLVSEDDLSVEDKPSLLSNEKLLCERIDLLNHEVDRLKLLVQKEWGFLRSLSNQKEVLGRERRSLGIKQKRLNLLLSYAGESCDQIDSIIIPHWNEATWLCPGFNREAANEALEGRLPGTFLIRPKTQDGSRFVLSVVNIDRIVRHAEIFRFSENGCYGFVKDFSVFDSLRTLVLYFSSEPLSTYNEELQVKLLYPTNAGRGNRIY